MGLIPDIRFPSIIDSKPEPSKTYRFDLETGEIGEQIDGYAAIQQFISKAIQTIRFHYPIYSDDYGCEIEHLLGKGFSEGFIKVEMVRMITEALIYDERIERVYDFDITSVHDEVNIAFKVDTIEGIISYRGVV